MDTINELSSSSISEKGNKYKRNDKALNSSSKALHKSKKKKHKRRKCELKSPTHPSRRETIYSACSSEVQISLGYIDHSQTDTGLDATFGPALPPNFLNKNKSEKEIIGPKNSPEIKKLVEKISESKDDEYCNEFIGPLPSGTSLTDNEMKLEKRALEMKIAGLCPNMNTLPSNNVREEWMLELPEVNILKSSLPTARQFQTKERPDFSDRSCWTDVLGKKKNGSLNDTKKSAHSKTQIEIKKSKARDEEFEKFSKKNKRDSKSLLEIHRDKLKSKKKDVNMVKQERRPFSRDIDLKINKIDREQTQSIVKKSKLLDSKFASGQAKYL